MTDAGGIIARLVAEGTSPQLIADVALALARAESAQELLDQRRAKDRERKRFPRNSVETVESAEFQNGVSFDKESPQTPKKLNPSPCVRVPRARGDYHRLPEGWEPTKPLPPKTQAKADQWPPGAIDDELAALHRWALNAKDENGKGRKKNWDTAWVNWIERRDGEQHGKANGNGQRPHGNRRESGWATARDFNLARS